MNTSFHLIKRRLSQTSSSSLREVCSIRCRASSWQSRSLQVIRSRPYSSSSSESSLSSSSPHPRRGLFSIPELQKPSDFTRLAAQAINECNGLRSLLAAKNDSDTSISSLHEALEILHHLDAISKLVCNVIDAAELTRSVHCVEAWRTSAHQAFSILADYMATLNSDNALYHALLRAQEYMQQNPDLFTEEEVRFSALLQAEFERDGIQLPDEQREKVRRLQNSVTELEGLFSNNLVHSNSSKNNNLFWADAAAVQDVLPTHVLQAYGLMNDDTTTTTATTTRVNEETGAPMMQLSRDNHHAQVLQSLLKYSDSSTLRQQVYLQLHTSSPENGPILAALVERRHQLATACGFDSYAQRFLSDKMCNTPQKVLQFLTQLQTATKPAFAKEMERLVQAKQYVEGNNSSTTIEPWDVSFYAGLLKQQTNQGFDIHSISHYLTLSNCLSSMKELVRCLFGIEMNEVKMTMDERWDVVYDNDNDHDDAASITNGVRRFDFFDTNTDTALGTMYLDLHPRPGKYGHAAHFTIRCGCVSNFASQSASSQPEYQLPIVALVCNLSSSTGIASNNDNNNDNNMILSHPEVETLFHEFGHALHSLLSRTEFQHMSGTRAATDFVETPSHLMENFVWDATFLKLLTRHVETGEAMPDDVIQQLQRSRYEFCALERMNQIIYALFDQKLFGVPSSSSSPSSGGTTTMELFASLHQDAGVPYATGTHWYTRFGHLVTYGAGYYGYLYAQVFASDIWKHLFLQKQQQQQQQGNHNQGLSSLRTAGHDLWHKMLIHGGAKDPALMLTDLLGRPPRIGTR